jgi:hypothetical protein
MNSDMEQILFSSIMARNETYVRQAEARPLTGSPAKMTEEATNQASVLVQGNRKLQASTVLTYSCIAH